MAEAELDRIGVALRDLPFAAGVTELRTRRLVRVNEQAAQLMDGPPAAFAGTEVAAYIHPDERARLDIAQAALADGAIDGYQVERRLVSPSGTELEVVLRVRRVDGPGGAHGLWIVVPVADGVASEPPLLDRPDVVLALTDHDWELEYMSADARLLGASSENLRGSSLVDLAHPSVRADVVDAISRAVTGRMAVTFATRLRTGPDRWADRSCLVVPMCDHNPPRLGVVVTSVGESPSPGAEKGLRPHAEHSALDARRVAALRALPAVAGNPHAGQLSARQIEIVSRLIAGERVDEIAPNLHLSTSTIRNHLTAIYRKFGIHSQAELLAMLFRAATADRERHQ